MSNINKKRPTKAAASDPAADDQSFMTDHKRKEMMGLLQPEPLLMDNPGRFVIFPIQHEDVSC